MTQTKEEPKIYVADGHEVILLEDYQKAISELQAEIKEKDKRIKMFSADMSGSLGFINDSIEMTKKISSLKKQIEELKGDILIKCGEIGDLKKQLSQSISKEKILEFCHKHRKMTDGEYVRGFSRCLFLLQELLSITDDTHLDKQRTGEIPVKGVSSVLGEISNKDKKVKE